MIVNGNLGTRVYHVECTDVIGVGSSGLSKTPAIRMERVWKGVHEPEGGILFLGVTKDVSRVPYTDEVFNLMLDERQALEVVDAIMRLLCEHRDAVIEATKATE